MKKITVMSECPRCHSNHTGKIAVRQGFSSKWERKSVLDSLNNAEFIKYVYPEEYRNYYSKYGINGYCEDCGYEFRGICEEIKLDTEDFNEYKKDMTLSYITKFTKPIKKSKRKNKLFNIFKIFTKNKDKKKGK